MSAFEAVNPTRTIFDKFRPQNCQLLLPMAYKYKCYTIKEPLHAIVLRTGSHSRREKDYSQQIATIDSYVEIHNKTLEGMSLPKDELHEYKLCCLNKLLLQKLDVALDYRKKKEALSFYSEIKMYGLHLSRGKIIKVYLLIISPVLLDIVLQFYTVLTVVIHGSESVVDVAGREYETVFFAMGNDFLENVFLCHNE